MSELWRWCRRLLVLAVFVGSVWAAGLPPAHVWPARVLIATVTTYGAWLVLTGRL